MSCRTCVDVSEVPLGYSIPVACSVVTGDANFTGATIIPEPHGKALDACGLKVDCTLTWRLAAAPVGEVDLSCSTLGRLEDDDMSWPPCSSGDGRASRKTRKLKLCGLQYGSLESKNEKSEKDQAKWRLDWLDSAETYSPQPYEELARVYRETGHSDLAQRVMMRQQREKRRRNGLTWLGRAWNLFLGVTVGHGYRPQRILLALVALAIFGSAVFYHAQDKGVMEAVAADKSSTSAPVSAKDCKSDYPCFYPPVYSVELLIPVVNLRHVQYWLPDISKPKGIWYAAYTWFAIVFGWASATALVAGLTRLWRT